MMFYAVKVTSENCLFIKICLLNHFTGESYAKLQQITV